MADWDKLPEVLLGKIFSYLSTVEKIQAGEVCSKWHYASLCRPEVWQTFCYSEDDIRVELGDMAEVRNPRKSKFFQIHQKLCDMVVNAGNHIKFLIAYLSGRESYSLLELMAEFCHNLKSVHVQLCPSEMESSMEKLQPTLWCLLQTNKQLENIFVKDVNFKHRNSPVPIGRDHSSSLVKLSIVNSFRSNNLGNLMYLLNVRELTISPSALNYSLLFHLVSHCLRDLYLVSTSKTKDLYNEAIHDWQWKEICRCGPKLSVHCHFSINYDWTEKEIILKPSMPLKTLIYCKLMLLNYENLSPLLYNYGEYLEVFVDFSLTMYNYSASSYFSQCPCIDKCILNFVRNCPKLHTFASKEVLSSSVILLMAYYNRNLKNLLILEDRVEYVDNLMMDDLPEDAVDFVRRNWRKERFEETMSDLLGFPWKPMKIGQYLDNLLQNYSAFL